MIKEFGSDFHYYNSEIEENTFFDNQNFHLFFSGRVAIYNLLRFGILNHGWKKVGFPSYYCHEVIDFCKDLNINIFLYNYNPLDDTELIWNDEPNSVIINVNYFGIRKKTLDFFKNTIVIEDVTHDLLSVNNSSADYFFASLRKQLPIGVGGFCTLREGENFSNLKLTAQATETFQKKLTAMFLKSEYLNNHFDQNNIYRNYFLDAEKMFEDKSTNSIMPLMAKTQLKMLPIEKLIRKTNHNISVGIQHLVPNINYKIVNNNDGFCLMIFCKTGSIRDNLRKYLIENKIFPAILWPHQNIDNDKEVENKILCVHMDFRYNEDEIKHISYTINNFFKNV